MGCGNERARSRWKALYTSRGQDSTQRISESQVFDLYAGEEMFQLFDVLFGRGRILPLGCQFHDTADFRNPIEPVPAAIAFHTMTQQLDGSKVFLGPRAVVCLSRMSVWEMMGGCREDAEAVLICFRAAIWR